MFRCLICFYFSKGASLGASASGGEEGPAAAAAAMAAPDAEGPRPPARNGGGARL